MASGSFTGSTSNNYITPRILWSSTPNTTANTSDITVTFQLHKSSASSSTTYGTGSWTLKINGVEYKFSKYQKFFILLFNDNSDIRNDNLLLLHLHGRDGYK